MSAKEAFKAYVRAYDSHHLKQIFDIETLDLAKVATSFGFIVPPAVDLSILLIVDKDKKSKNFSVFFKFFQILSYKILHLRSYFFVSF